MALLRQELLVLLVLSGPTSSCTGWSLLLLLLLLTPVGAQLMHLSSHEARFVSDRCPRGDRSEFLYRRLEKRRLELAQHIHNGFVELGLAQPAVRGRKKLAHPLLVAFASSDRSGASVARVLFCRHTLCDLHDLLLHLPVALPACRTLAVSIILQTMVAPDTDLVATRTRREGQICRVKWFAA